MLLCSLGAPHSASGGCVRHVFLWGGERNIIWITSLSEAMSMHMKKRSK